ncbi:MAG: hypothetical protein NT124_03170 [Candidatus Dependentiae bacterium]|nr:hypothetical protein [Candidatus Dependentiae bacterium]
MSRLFIGAMLLMGLDSFAAQEAGLGFMGMFNSIRLAGASVTQKVSHAVGHVQQSWLNIDPSDTQASMSSQLKQLAQSYGVVGTSQASVVAAKLGIEIPDSFMQKYDFDRYADSINSQKARDCIYRAYHEGLSNLSQDERIYLEKRIIDMQHLVKSLWEETIFTPLQAVAIIDYIYDKKRDRVLSDLLFLIDKDSFFLHKPNLFTLKESLVRKHKISLFVASPSSYSDRRQRLQDGSGQLLRLSVSGIEPMSAHAQPDVESEWEHLFF